MNVCYIQADSFYLETASTVFHVVCKVPTTAGRGGGGRMAPVAPNAGLPRAKDAHWVAPHLDKIDGPRLEACEAARCQIADIVHQLMERSERNRVCKETVLTAGGGKAERP